MSSSNQRSLIRQVPLLALFLAMVHALSGLAILMVSAWFIAACAVSGVGFNYMLPAVVIRALALIRISSGYAEMWVGHKHLLRSLSKLRLTLFSEMQNSPEPSSAEEADKLTFHTEAVASVWVGWVAQNASAWISATSVLFFTLWFVPLLSALWMFFALASLTISVVAIWLSIAQAKRLALLRIQLERDIQFKVDSVDIWHLYNSNTLPNASDFYRQISSIKQMQKAAEWALLIISISGVVVAIQSLYKAEYIQPIGLVIPMVLLAAPDWLGRIFGTNTRLLDYVDGSKALAHKGSGKDISNTAKVPLEQGSVDNLERVSSLSLIDFLPSNAKHQPISFSINSPNLLLVEGDSGIGKSRLLKALSGFVQFGGELLLNQQTSTKDVVTNPHILLTEQSPYCLSGTLRDNLLVANSNASDEDCLAILRSLNLNSLSNLDQWLGTNGRSLSGGELKRLGLARALLSNASVILLDEPFEGLDEANIENVSNKINGLAEKRIVIVVSHVQPEQLNLDKTIRLGN